MRPLFVDASVAKLRRGSIRILGVCQGPQQCDSYPTACLGGFCGDQHPLDFHAFVTHMKPINKGIAFVVR